MNDLVTTESNTDIVVKPKKPIDTVRNALEKMKPQFMAALPKHITPERMMRVALTACQNTPKLLECEPKSLLSAIMRAAQLGLEPDGIMGQAYLIPYGKTVQFIPGYKGLIDLARRSGEVSNIIAKEVYSNDEFSVDFAQEIPFTHKPKLSGDRGVVTHFWAMARFKDGGFHWDYMTLAEVEAIRDQSQGYQSAVKYGKTADSPWKKHFVEMGKKTLIRRIAKFLPMSVQKAALVNDLVDAGKSFSMNEFDEIVIDGSAEEIEEGGAVDETKRLGNDAVKDKIKKAKAEEAGADPETGEIVDNSKAAPASEVKSSDKPIMQKTASDDDDARDHEYEASQRKSEPLPTFTLGDRPLKTQAEIKAAVTELCNVLAHYPAEERGGVFVGSGGNELAGAASRAGLTGEKQKFVALGVKFAS